MQPPSPPTSVAHSFDRDRDKPPFTAVDVDPILKFVQANRPLSDVTSPHPTDKLPALLHRGSKGTDAAQRSLSPQHLADSLNFDHAQDIARTPLAQHLDTENSNSIVDAAHSFDTNNADIADTSSSDSNSKRRDIIDMPSLAAGQKAISVECGRCKGAFTCIEAAPGGTLTKLGGGEVDDLRAVCKQRGAHKRKRRQGEKVSIERRGL